MNKTKYKKSELGLGFGVIATMILVAIVVGLLLYQFKVGFSSTGKNIVNLESCENQGGDCKTKDECESDGTGFYKYGGCPKTEDDLKIYCCIPKNKI